MGEIWVTSDTHFCHDKSFLFGPRGFMDEWSMNEAIINNWNSVVAYNDDVYLLGDCYLVNNPEGIACMKSLNGRIHIARGNHDTDTRILQLMECYNVVEIEDIYRLHIGKASFYLSHYPTMVGNFDDEKRHATYCLCGHSHTQNKWLHKQFNCYHCELDAHGLMPVNIEQIRADIRKEKEKQNGY